MAKLNNREPMVPWGVTFTHSPGTMPHRASTTHTTRIWATTRQLAETAAAEMISDPAGLESTLWWWGVSGFTATIATEPDADLSIWRTDVFTSSLLGFYEFSRPPIVDFDCLDDDDLATIGAKARAKAATQRSNP